MSDTPKLAMSMFATKEDYLIACLQQSKREIADLRANLEEARKDAERYRWLRGRALSVDWSYRLSGNWRQSECRRSGEQMDTSIDAAIAQGKGEK